MITVSRYLLLLLSIFYMSCAQADELKTGWPYKNEIISPKCFPISWYSGDNWEEFADKFSINIISGENYNDFFRNPGKFIGREITNFDPIPYPWDNNLIYFGANNLYFVRDLETCDYEANQISANDGQFIFDSNLAHKDEGVRKSYILHDKVELDICQELAPNFDGKCVSSYLASVFLTDKYLRSDVAHTMIYGLFDFEGRDLLVPLKGWIYYSPEKGQAFLKKKRSN